HSASRSMRRPISPIYVAAIFCSGTVTWPSPVTARRSFMRMGITWRWRSRRLRTLWSVTAAPAANCRPYNACEIPCNEKAKSIAARAIDDMFERQVGFAAVDLAQDVAHQRARRGLRRIVRGDRDFWVRPKRRGHRQRLGSKHVQRRTEEHFLVEGCEDV